jgi:hypothetical protein
MEEEFAMAADPALSLSRISEAMRAFFSTLSDPESLPEFETLQVCCRSLPPCSGYCDLPCRCEILATLFALLHCCRCPESKQRSPLGFQSRLLRHMRSLTTWSPTLKTATSRRRE